MGLTLKAVCRTFAGYETLYAVAGAFANVLDAVLTYGAQKLDQREVAVLAGTSDGTVSRGRRASGGFGPLLLPAPVGFSPEMGIVLACSVGSESVRCGLVDANGTVHNPKSAEPKRGQLLLSPDELLARVRHQVIRVLEDAFDENELLRGDNTLPLLGAALAIPAPVDRMHLLRGTALPHPAWYESPRGAGSDDLGVSLNSRFGAMLGAPFEPDTAQVMNDCHVAAVAMAFERVRELEPPRTSGSDARRERTMAMLVRVSGGVGSSMIEVASDSPELHVSRFLKSRVMVGTNGLAGEIGHLPVSRSAVENINERSRPFARLRALDWERNCSCGQPHHLQALTGWHALCQRLGLPLDDPSLTLTELLAPYLNPADGHEHQAAARALADAGRLIGRALTGPVLTLDPHSVTVIGALAGPNLLSGMMEAQGEWSKAFWTGRKVAFDKQLHGSKFMALRGAGLVLLRAHRHRKLREIAAGAWADLAPLLPYSAAHLSKLRRSAES